jgi:hypothetical protein
MTRSFAALALACILPLAAGCDGQSGHGAAQGAQFVAANSSTVIIDTSGQNDAELDQARAMANQKCALFGGAGAVLESLNVISHGRERASFICK